MKKSHPTAESDSQSPMDRAREIEDMILKRAKELTKKRLDEAAFAKVSKKKLIAKLKKMRLLKRCHKCPAMRLYVKNGGKIKK